MHKMRTTPDQDKLFATAQAIAKFLPRWNAVCEDRGDDDFPAIYIHLLHETGAMLSLRFDNDRLNVSTSYPRHLHNFINKQGSNPDHKTITMSASRRPASMAVDIGRRIAPFVIGRLPVIQRRYDEKQEMDFWRKDTAEALRNAAGTWAKVHPGTHSPEKCYVEVKRPRGSWYELEVVMTPNYDKTIQIQGHLPVELALKFSHLLLLWEMDHAS